jgi:glycosyltransferase involved in cell wall biosynthesis
MMDHNNEIRCVVCIPTYNQAQYLAAAVASAEDQDCPVDVIVSNDASTDNTSDVLSAYKDSRRVKICDHTVNLGIGAHVHWLLRQPTSEFVVRLDSDDLLRPAYVSELSALLDLYPSAGYAHCAVMEIDEHGLDKRVRRLFRSHRFQSAEASLRAMALGYKVAANIIMFRREALASVNFGSPDLNFGEDYYLSILLADAGWGNVYCHKILASYRTWDGPRRPAFTRKMQEIQGLTAIFANVLQDCYSRRGWNARILRIRRLELALQHSAALDRLAISKAERDLIVNALSNLGGGRWLALLLGNRMSQKAARLTVLHKLNLRPACARLCKRLLHHLRLREYQPRIRRDQAGQPLAD